MSTGVIIVLSFYAGYVVAWLLNRKPPVIKNAKIDATLVIDQTALDKIEQARVFEWLEQRGLTWQPKGAVFDPDRKIDK